MAVYCLKLHWIHPLLRFGPSLVIVYGPLVIKPLEIWSGMFKGKGHTAVMDRGRVHLFLSFWQCLSAEIGALSEVGLVV